MRQEELLGQTGSVQFLHPTNLEQALRCLTSCSRFKYFCESLCVFKLNLTIHTFLAPKRHCMFLFSWLICLLFHFIYNILPLKCLFILPFTCLLFYVFKLFKCLVDPSCMYLFLYRLMADFILLYVSYGNMIKHIPAIKHRHDYVACVQCMEIEHKTQILRKQY